MVGIQPTPELLLLVEIRTQQLEVLSNITLKVAEEALGEEVHEEVEAEEVPVGEVIHHHIIRQLRG